MSNENKRDQAVINDLIRESGVSENAVLKVIGAMRAANPMGVALMLGFEEVHKSDPPADGENLGDILADAVLHESPDGDLDLMADLHESTSE